MPSIYDWWKQFEEGRKETSSQKLLKAEFEIDIIAEIMDLLFEEIE